MNLNLPSCSPKDLIDGDMYLCGRISLVEEIDWYTCVCKVDNSGTVYLHHPLAKFLPEQFLCSPDGFTDAYLLFRLPDTYQEYNSEEEISEDPA